MNATQKANLINALKTAAQELNTLSSKLYPLATVSNLQGFAHEASALICSADRLEGINPEDITSDEVSGLTNDFNIACIHITNMKKKLAS